MCVCMYVQVFTYVHGYVMTIDVYIRKCIYVYVHIKSKTYLRVYIECVGDRMYFVQEPLIQLCEWKWSNKSGTAI